MAEPDRQPNYRLRRSDETANAKRLFNAPDIVLLIAVLTIACFALMVMAPARTARIVEAIAAVSPYRLMQGGDVGFFSRWSPLIGHMFVHAGPAHLAVNMLFLLAFGAPIARRMRTDDRGFQGFYAGSLFLSFYLLSGIAGALAFVAAHANVTTLLIGASGGVSGLLGGLVRFAFNRSTIFGPENARMSSLASPSVIAWTSVIVLTNLGVGLLGGPLSGGARIAWEAHLGGYFFGLLTYPFFEAAARRRA